MPETVDLKQIKSIGDLILQNKVIPIVGYELLWINSEVNKSEFISHLVKNLDSKLIKDDVVEDFQRRFPKAPTSELINHIYHSLKDRKEKGSFNFEFSKAINRARAELPIFWDPIIKLALIKNFKLYVNVTCANVLEIAINSFRAKSADEYEVYGPLKPQKRDLPDPKTNFFEKPYALSGIQKTSIYNLFGTYNTDSTYLLTDVEYVDLLVEFLQKDTFCLNFQKYLSNACLLFIGCSFPDWFLRFFTRFWAGPEMDFKLADQYNILIDSLNESDLSERSFFISNYKITTLSGETIDFINHLYDYVQNPNRLGARNGFLNNNNPLRPKALQNFVFISYSWLDAEIAKALKKILEENHIHVWLDDEQLRTGSGLDEPISNALTKSCVVLQIVSDNISRRKDQDPYFLREWKLILDQEMNRIPVLVDGVNGTMLVPAQLQKYKSVIQDTLNPDILAIKINSDNVTLSDKDIQLLQETQYRASIKDLKIYDL